MSKRKAKGAAEEAAPILPNAKPGGPLMLVIQVNTSAEATMVSYEIAHRTDDTSQDTKDRMNELAPMLKEAGDHLAAAVSAYMSGETDIVNIPLSDGGLMGKPDRQVGRA